MKGRDLGILLLVGAGLGGAVYFASRKKAASNLGNTPGPAQNAEAPVPAYNMLGQPVALTPVQSQVQSKEVAGLMKGGYDNQTGNTPLMSVVNADGTVTTFYGTTPPQKAQGPF